MAAPPHAPEIEGRTGTNYAICSGLISGSRMASFGVQEEGDDGREGSTSYFARDAQFSQRERL